ncbi:MAG: hypothetical protein CMO98_02365 [Woeseia sp.]|nr:hypothetical protein [Woeseia sp.]
MSAGDKELYSLLVPLVDERLLIPRASVAEVIRYESPKDQTEGKGWLLGTIMWNSRDLPVIAFEGTMGRDLPIPIGRTRIVILYSTTGKIREGFFGILTQGFPQLVRVNEEVLKLDSTDGWANNAPVLCRVKMINEYPLIPNFEMLEHIIAQRVSP